MPRTLKDFGPGLVIAATGLGAGDLVAASVAGANFGTAILWAAVAGAIIKYVLNEGLARWQIATGSTLLEGWMQRLPALISVYFFVYLLLWTFVVAGALMAACGLAAHAIYPVLSVEQWGVIHSLLALVLVGIGRYTLLETIMKMFIALMFAVVIVCAVLVAPDIAELARGLLVPAVPDGAAVFIISVIGGIGGSVTLLCYGYWIRERNWTNPQDLGRIRRDLAAAYTLTGLFGIAIMIISAGVRPEVLGGAKMALSVANHLGSVTGAYGKWCFLIGFWCAVFSSMLGVWQGVPYIFADVVHQYSARAGLPAFVNTRSPAYRGYLLYTALPPMLLLLFVRPVWMVVIYAVAGAFFMPLLAVLLLYMNNRRSWVKQLHSGQATNAVLIVSVIVFGLLLIGEIGEYIP
jgi:Mn2+/Fe2+ NRAMP family transporter